MENQTPSPIEDQQLAHQMAEAEHQVRGPASDLARAMGQTSDEYFTPEQLAAQNSAASQASQAVEQQHESQAQALAEQMQQNPAGDILRAIQEDIVADANNNTVDLSPRKFESIMGALSRGELSREQTERISCALAFEERDSISPELRDLPVPTEEIKGRFRGGSRSFANNGSPVEIGAWTGESGAQPKIFAMPKGGNPNDGWDVMRINEVERFSRAAFRYGLVSVPPSQDGVIHLGREDSSTVGVYAFGQPTDGYSQQENEAAQAKVSKSHLSIATGPEGELVVQDHSTNGSTYRQFEVYGGR